MRAVTLAGTRHESATIGRFHSAGWTWAAGVHAGARRGRLDSVRRNLRVLVGALSALLSSNDLTTGYRARLSLLALTFQRASQPSTHELGRDSRLEGSAATRLRQAETWPG